MSDSEELSLRERIEQKAVYAKIPLDLIEPNPSQPRRFFDQEALRALAESIRGIGLLEDILVTPRGDRYMIVLGERRWRATKLAELPTISAKVVQLTDDEMRKIGITENIQREDLTRVEEAFAFKKYVDEGLQQKQVGEAFGNMQNRVAERLKFLSSHYYIQFQEQRIAELEAKVASLDHKEKENPYQVEVIGREKLAAYLQAGYDLVHSFSDGELVVRRLARPRVDGD